MKRDNMQDERITLQRRKIYSEAFGILIIMLFLSVLIKQFILNYSFEQYVVELVGLFGILIYVLIRYIMLGVDLFDDKNNDRTNSLVMSLTAGLSVTTINGILNFLKYSELYNKDGLLPFIAVLLVTFISATSFSFISISFLAYLNKKKQVKISNKLDADE